MDPRALILLFVAVSVLLRDAKGFREAESDVVCFRAKGFASIKVNLCQLQSQRRSKKVKRTYSVLEGVAWLTRPKID